jgi:RNA polymerase sigma-70 factor (ECF subfamily)
MLHSSQKVFLHQGPFSHPRHFSQHFLYKISNHGCLLGELSNFEQPDSAWCEALYEAKAPGLVLYGRALGLSHGEAEDVVQETFLALMRLPAPPDEPEHYCLRTFRNRALNFRRGLWRRLTRELESHRWFERSGGETPFERAAIRCLEKLPAEQREVIVLKIWHEHTFEEIGRLLERSPNTVSGRYRYGLEKLRECLSEANVEALLEPGSEPLTPSDGAREKKSEALELRTVFVTPV